MDKAGPQRDLPEHHETTDRVAEGRPEGIRAPTYAEIAPKLFDQGYEPLPILPGQKRPAVHAWTTVDITEAKVEEWCRTHGDCGVGLRTGHLIAVDIDILDPDMAQKAAEITQLRLGTTVVRVGQWPKHLLLYRTESPFGKLRVGKIEVLGLGQQFVAFGIHPTTGRPYEWPLGDSPLDTALEDLPLVDETAIEMLLAELQPDASAAPSGSSRGSVGGKQDVSRDAGGVVVDGRDSWLSIIAFHALHDAIDAGEELDESHLSSMVWARFADSTDRSRHRQDGRRTYDQRDALRKMRDKIRLHRDGLLPDRCIPQAAPDYTPPTMAVEDARNDLDRHLQDFVTAVENWHRDGAQVPPPRIGIRATVGLGKSTAARRHIVNLMQRLAADGLPHRVLYLVPSLALADEAALAFTRLGIQATILRGYEAKDAITGTPMCGDIHGIRAAVAARRDIQSSVCFRSQKQRCPQFLTCPKQANRRDVREAEVVIAAYDTMFTGFAGDADGFAMVLVDEACWARSYDVAQSLTIEALPHLGLSGVAASRKQDAQAADLADVLAARHELVVALLGLPPGDVTASALASHDVDAAFCDNAIIAERAALPADHLSPGQGMAERKGALERSARRAISLQVMDLWTALAGLLREEAAATAKVWLGASGKDGQRPIRIYRRKHMSGELSRLPLLHLDATLRPDLASVILPGLHIVTVDAAALHQHLRLISGNFGKSKLIQDSRATAAENRRHANRLRECVDYVRWHALRHQGKRILVITYQAAEVEFAAIPGVETAHYNAIAGLDVWGDIEALFLVGRLLPQSDDLRAMTGAIFDHSAQGEYSGVPVGLVTETGRASAIRAIRHTDPFAEVLRGAICDDEVMQALGRGRGVNRTTNNPLEVHVLADIVLPVAYERVQAWQAVCPDIVQQMLLAGLAVDSPADAARLHPGLFGTAKSAEHHFARTGFNPQNPIRDIYREMGVKSASYRLGGRGKGWQRAYWIAGSEQDARKRFEGCVGQIAEWLPD